ncbi:MAG: hypothetical protein A2096_09945 [Spirochaetes bacterium GWF1_41_5]|nr:MAG: hypothetical protein A2096_09945 [Spirochaetes bacterium GWF1_41_5]HBE03976.1 hypothetical protein [Spirochaetia bacterium]
MNTKLTLRLNENVIDQIKIFTSQNNISISRLTEKLFENIILLERSAIKNLTPIAKKYKGILADTKENYDDIKYKILKNKYE